MKTRIIIVAILGSFVGFFVVYYAEGFKIFYEIMKFEFTSVNCYASGEEMWVESEESCQSQKEYYQKLGEEAEMKESLRRQEEWEMRYQNYLKKKQ